jgi:predicted Zn-dependent protease
MTLVEIQANIFGFGKRTKALHENAEGWRKLSTAYAKAGQFREADDAQSEACSLESEYTDMLQNRDGILNI